VQRKVKKITIHTGNPVLRLSLREELRSGLKRLDPAWVIVLKRGVSISGAVKELNEEAKTAGPVVVIFSFGEQVRRGHRPNRNLLTK
jgi:hypothetical protein